MSFLSQFTHKREMRESKDEIMVGVIVHEMARRRCPAVGFNAGAGDQTIRFKPTASDEVLHSVQITLDRKTGGGTLQAALVGHKAVLRFVGEVRNHLADPDDLLQMYRTDMQNVLKSPLFGQVKINHQITSIYGTRQVVIDIDDYVQENGRPTARLAQLFDDVLNELREKLAPYKK
jgi:hypothetical protein